jgi:DNA-binding IclR family transcriptional regulator
MSDTSKEPYPLAQHAIADLKTAVLKTIRNGPPEGMANVEIGKTLGIYTGHVGHEGHIPRTILAMLEDEGVVEQDDESKRWTIVDHGK